MERPYVFINAAMTLDGKISTIERKQVRISSDKDMERMDGLRAQSDAVLVGMNTVLTDDPKLNVKSQELRDQRKEKGLHENPMKVSLGRLDGLNLDSEFLSHGGAEKVLFASPETDSYKIEELQAKADVFVSETDPVDPEEVLQNLHEMGVEILMVEGGARTNFSFLSKGLVDKIYVAIGPLIFGGGKAPTLVDGEGFKEKDAIRLRLNSVNKLGSELIAEYDVLNK